MNRGKVPARQGVLFAIEEDPPLALGPDWRLESYRIDEHGDESGATAQRKYAVYVEQPSPWTKPEEPLA